MPFQPALRRFALLFTVIAAAASSSGCLGCSEGFGWRRSARGPLPCPGGAGPGAAPRPDRHGAGLRARHARARRAARACGARGPLAGAGRGRGPLRAAERLRHPGARGRGHGRGGARRARRGVRPRRRAPRTGPRRRGATRSGSCSRPASTSPDLPAATWTVTEGGTLARRRPPTSVDDRDDGSPRIRVAAPAAFAASGRAVPPRLSVQGAAIALWIDAGGEAVLVDPVWTAEATMTTIRDSHTATLLGTGKVRRGRRVRRPTPPTSSAGSSTTRPANTWTATASIRPAPAPSTPRAPAPERQRPGDGRLHPRGDDRRLRRAIAPTSGTWAPAAAMNSGALPVHRATLLLRSGDVLVLGWPGHDQTVALSQTAVEVYAPGSNTWTITPAMHSLRTLRPHRDPAPANGKVLVAGGGTVGCRGRHRRWRPPRSTIPVRQHLDGGGEHGRRASEHTEATLLAERQGPGDAAATSPVGATRPDRRQTSTTRWRNTWSPAGTPMRARGRAHQSATLLPGGPGGRRGRRLRRDDRLTALAELYDPTTNAFTATASMLVPRQLPHRHAPCPATPCW